MLVDSHCHLNFPELFQTITDVRAAMDAANVGHALCVSVTLDKVHEVIALAEAHDNFYASVGVHPDYENIEEPTVDKLMMLAKHPKVVAIGETGLDYFRLKGDLSWQRSRFRTHIQAAIATQKPLIIHTRQASEDTINILKEEGASAVGGVMHCFTESLAVAEQAIALGFYISFSGIVTFKNARDLQEVVKAVPLNRILVETDSPYLAPIPFRGKINQPAYVKHVAQKVADLKEISLDEVMQATTANFFNLFKDAKPCS